MLRKSIKNLPGPSQGDTLSSFFLTVHGRVHALRQTQLCGAGVTPQLLTEDMDVTRPSTSVLHTSARRRSELSCVRDEPTDFQTQRLKQGKTRTSASLLS